MLENRKLKKLLLILIAMLISSASLKAQNGGYCLDFTATTNQYVSFADPANHLDVSAYTIELWFYWEGTYVQFLTAKDFEGFEIHTTDDSHGQYGLRFIPADFNSSISGVYLDTRHGAIKRNEWTHVSFSYDPAGNGGSGFASCYINGKYEGLVNHGDSPLSTPIEYTDDPFLIGSRILTALPFTGKIDEVRVWSDVRTADEVRANMYRELTSTGDGLVAYYKMSNGAGTTVTDNGPNGLNGTTYNSPYWQTSGALAGSRTALDFDGTNEYVVTSSSPSLTSSFTAECWFNAESSSQWKHLIEVGTTQNAALRMELGNEGQIYVAIGDGTAYTEADYTSTGWTLNTWNHLALVYNGTTTASVYLNGSLVGAFACNKNINSAVGDLRIGGSSISGTRYFDGQIDEVRIWNDVRTEAEIRENMMKNLIGNETGLIAYYNFNDGEGSTLHDLTSNALNGTLTNMEDADWVSSGAFNMWIGNESNVSNNAANWSDGVPGANSNVNIVPFNLSFSQPIISSPTFNHFYTNLGALHSNINVNGNLLLNYLVSLNGQTVTLGPNAYLSETENGTFYGISGKIETTRNLSGITAENVGGLGAIITTAADMGSTLIQRNHTSNDAVFGVGNSVNRIYMINPTNNAGLNASLVFSYSDYDLNFTTEANLKLAKSTDAGTTWTNEGGTVVTNLNTITLTGINSFSRWTATDVSLEIELTTSSILNIGNSTALGGGTITNDGGLSITVSGICWNTSGTPTTADSKTTDGATSETSFTSQLTALSPYQIYYVRAYATNASGTYYGNEVSFTTVPTLGEWGLILLGSLFALGGGLLVWRRFVI